MITDVTEQEKSDFKPEEIARLKTKFPDIIVDVKSAHYQKPDWASVDWLARFQLIRSVER